MTPMLGRSVTFAHNPEQPRPTGYSSSSSFLAKVGRHAAAQRAQGCAAPPRPLTCIVGAAGQANRGRRLKPCGWLGAGYRHQGRPTGPCVRVPGL